jgi:hypothetical protein
MWPATPRTMTGGYLGHEEGHDRDGDATHLLYDTPKTPLNDPWLCPAFAVSCRHAQVRDLDPR